jgi:hypothetical protein
MRSPDMKPTFFDRKAVVYKLTDANSQTYDKTQWGEGVTHRTNGTDELCGPGWLHAYTHPLLAVFLNPIHANFVDPILWEAEADGKTLSDKGLKVGYSEITTIRQIPLPVVTTFHRIRFAILCARSVYKNSDWLAWADNWLSGKDRSAEAAAAAEAEARAAWAAEARAAWAAKWAPGAAWAEARAAWAAKWAPGAAAWAAWAAGAKWAAEAAGAAARAAEWAAEADIDLIAIAQQVGEFDTDVPKVICDNFAGRY